MSLSHSPGIVTNGLVFEYDMANTSKSWKGAPTTNLLTNTNAISAWTRGGGITSVVDNAVAPDGTNTASLVTANGVSNSFVSIGGSITSGNTYTKSVIAKAGTTGTLVFESYDNNGSGGTAYYSTEFNLNTGTYSGTGHTASIRHLGSGWYLCAATRAYTLNTVGGTFYIGAYGAGSGTLYLWHPQMELGSVASPYTTGTRSNTQALIDLTNNNTITATSLTYASDGTFSFDGTSNYVVFPENSALNTQTPTVEVWVKTNATTQSGFLFEKGNVNTQYALFQEGANITWRHTTNVGSLTAPTASYMNTSQYAQVVGTYTSGDRRIYVNGAQVASDAMVYTLPTNANGCSIGVYGGFNGTRGYYYNGSIASVKVYNRALSASEVKQNFNALRGRYGI